MDRAESRGAGSGRNHPLRGGKIRCAVWTRKRRRKRQPGGRPIARSAAEQCGRAVIPEVSRPVSFAEALKQASELDVILIPYELERGMEETAEIIRNIRPGQSVGIFIGPEGGFDAEEVEKAKAAGARPVSLGFQDSADRDSGSYSPFDSDVSS